MATKVNSNGNPEVHIAISPRATAALAGILFLAATASFIAGEQIMVHVLRSPQTIAESGGALALGGLLAFGDGIAVIGIAVLLFPVLRQVSEPLALGYVGLRVTEFAAILLYVASPLYVAAFTGSAANTIGLSGLAPAMRAEHDMALQLIYLFNGVAGGLFAVLLFRSRLVPGWIAVLGLIGYPVLLVGTILAIFGVTDVTQGVGTVSVVPGALFELILPIWLIARGFAHSDGIEDASRSWVSMEHYVPTA